MMKVMIGAAAGWAALAAPAWADEGMWTLDAFPAAAVQKSYGFNPDKAFLDRVQASAVRLVGGCSASVVSPNGLVLTNHHCVIDCVQNLSTTGHDYARDGYVATRPEDEKACPGFQAEILTGITDVTGRVQAAIGTRSGDALNKARDAAIAAFESEGDCAAKTMHCQVVTLYGGGQYKLYRYRKYDDVRIVFAPEYVAAQFGGDPDNFNFPRYGLDCGFLRLYENGKPVATPAHLTWAARAPQPGELVFVAGNPGSTQRQYTVAQLTFLRDTSIPIDQLVRSELRGRIIGAMGDDAERLRTGNKALFGIENSFKARYGQERALVDPTFFAGRVDAEQQLRARIAADPAAAARLGDPWAEVARATALRQQLFLPYYTLEQRVNATGATTLVDYARRLVRAAAERQKPNADRLRGYTDAELPHLEHLIVDDAPAYPWLEEVGTAFWLSKAREYLGADSPYVQHLLGKESPEALAHRLIAGTKLGDPKVRKALYDGGAAAIALSSDPLIQFVRATDPDARAVRTRIDAEVEAPITAAQSRLGQARLAAYGAAAYPDATFTLRLSYGAVKGWQENGADLEPVTRFAGLYQRATGFDPYKLAPRWAAAQKALDSQTVFDFTSTNDIIGGNSGSPVIDRTGAVIGAAFDGNIHSLGGAFGYDATNNRSVSVSTGAITEALTKVYRFDRIVDELKAR